MDKLTCMKAFTLVVETGSFSAASERLGITRAAASKYISQLESQLGVRLLNRTTRYVSMTESGRIYFERCKEMQHFMEEADDMVAGLSSVPKGTLRISAPSVFAHRHLVPLLSEFNQLYPDVNTEIMVSERLVDLVDEGYDLAIRVPYTEDVALVARRLTSCKHVVVASPAYLKTAPKLTEHTDLKHHACMLFTFTLNHTWPLEKDGEEFPVKVTPVLTSNNPEVLLDAAIAGMGITIMPTFIAYEAIQRGQLKTVLNEYTLFNLDIYAVYASRHYLPAKIRIFIDFLTSKIQDPPYWDNFSRVR